MILYFYKRIDGSYKLNEGDIIVFKKRYKPTNKTIKLVHRIEEVYMYKDEIWEYHTKGDAVDEFQNLLFIQKKLLEYILTKLIEFDILLFYYKG